MDTTIKLLSDVFDGTSIRTKDDLDELSLKRKRELRGELVDAMEELDAELRDEHDPQKQDKFRAASRLVDRLNRDAEVRNYSGNSFPGGGENTSPGGGSDVETLTDKRTGKTVRVYGPNDSIRAAKQRNATPEQRQLTLGGFLRSMVEGPQTDAERRALAESTDNTGGFAVPEILAGEMFDALSARSVVRQSGARIADMASNKMTLAGFSSLPSGSWRDEGESVSTGDPTVAAVELNAHTYAVIVKASRELISDSPNLETALTRAFGQKLALVLDQAALTGSGGSDPTGITNFSGGLNSYSASQKMSDYGPYANAVSLCELDNAAKPETAVIHPDVELQHNTLMVDTTGQPLQRPDGLKELSFRTTTSCPATKSILGGFEDLVIGLRDEVRIEVLRERYADNLQYGFLAYIRMDVGAIHEQSFAVIDTITT